MRKGILGLLFFSALFSCGDRGSNAPPASPASVSLDLVKTTALTTDADGGSARPEVIALGERVFVLYLGHIRGDMTEKTFDVKIYDTGLSSSLSSTTIVSCSPEYGSPTDIRVAADGQYLFTFFETTTTTTTYLHGAKYALNDSFGLAARTEAPLASSKPVFQLKEGEEILNDPAPLVGPNSVFVMTRLWSSITTTGNTIYRVRELSKSDLSLLSQFDLDLSAIADGRARVASLLYQAGSIYLALATTVSDAGVSDTNKSSDDGALSDILLLTMGPDWSFDPRADVRTLSSESGDRENYITGLRTDGTNLFLTYKQAVGVPPTGEQRAMIKIFDSSFTLVSTETVKSVPWGPGGGQIRPSLEISGKTIYSGQDNSTALGTGNAEVFVYEMR